MNHACRRDDPGIHLWVGFNGATLEEELKFLIREYSIGGVVLFRRNVTGPEQLRELLREMQAVAVETLGRPLWVAIDQEGGPVQRLAPPFTQIPAAREVARQGAEAVSDWAAKVARELFRTGIQVNLAPVLDVAPEGESHFMEKRCLSEDPECVSYLGRLWIEALQNNGVCATAKHFPGLGGADLDPHHFAPVIRRQGPDAVWKDIRPFHDAIRAGVRCVMTSHALYQDLDAVWPATLSPVICREWLRDRLGFNGVLLSDDMDMAAIRENYGWETAIRQGLLSSIDVFLVCQNSANIGPFYREFTDSIARDPVLAAARAQSLERMNGFLKYHNCLGEWEGRGMVGTGDGWGGGWVSG